MNREGQGNPRQTNVLPANLMRAASFEVEPIAPVNQPLEHL